MVPCTVPETMGIRVHGSAQQEGRSLHAQSQLSLDKSWVLSPYFSRFIHSESTRFLQVPGIASVSRHRSVNKTQVAALE